MGGCKPPCADKAARLAHEKRERAMGREYADPLRLLAISDVHIPYHSPEAVGAVLDFARYYKPNVFVVNGDFFDFYAVSSYSKDPAREESLQEELDRGAALLKAFKAACAPGARLVFLAGNHEDRLRRYLWNQAPALSKLRALAFETVTGLDALGFETYAYGEVVGLGKLHFVHGDLVRKGAGMTAKGMLQRYRVNVVHGHTHRVGHVMETTLGGEFAAWEMGCLADLRPEYIKGVPDWQHGVGVGTLYRNGLFDFQVSRIIEGHRFFHNGRVYHGRWDG